jgi:hypothetical protein
MDIKYPGGLNLTCEWIMNRAVDLKNYDKVLSAFHRLCEAMPMLIEQSGMKHRQIYEHPDLKTAQIKMGKDTFYRRLNTSQWTPGELAAILPMVVESIRKNNKEFYREFKLVLNEQVESSQEILNSKF